MFGHLVAKVTRSASLPTLTAIKYESLIFPYAQQSPAPPQAFLSGSTNTATTVQSATALSNLDGAPLPPSTRSRTREVLDIPDGERIRRHWADVSSTPARQVAPCQQAIHANHSPNDALATPNGTGPASPAESIHTVTIFSRSPSAATFVSTFETQSPPEAQRPFQRVLGKRKLDDLVASTETGGHGTEAHLPKSVQPKSKRSKSIHVPTQAPIKPQSPIFDPVAIAAEYRRTARLASGASRSGPVRLKRSRDEHEIDPAPIKSISRKRICANDLRLVEMLADNAGSTCKVAVVEVQGQKGAFIAKIMPRPAPQDQTGWYYALSERETALEASKPCPSGRVVAPKLYSTFTTEDHLVMIMEHCGGGDVCDRFQAMEDTTFEDLRLLFAEHVLLISDMHAQKILHRDIKPENLFVKNDGRLCIGDFGQALLNGKLSSDTCGTYGYQAPEGMKHYPYIPASDWFSLGVTFYRYAHPQHEEPFYGPEFTEGLPSESPYVKELLDNGRLLRPLPETVHPKIRGLVHALLHCDPRKRLTGDAVRDHVLFEGFCWENLENKRTPASFDVPLREPVASLPASESTVLWEPFPRREGVHVPLRSKEDLFDRLMDPPTGPLGGLKAWIRRDVSDKTESQCIWESPVGDEAAEVYYHNHWDSMEIDDTGP